MLITDEGLNSVIWIQRNEKGDCEVRVGDGLLVFRGREDLAFKIERKLKDVMMFALKEGILALTRDLCEVCRRGEMPKRRLDANGDFVGLMHKHPTLGWQTCEVEHLYLVFMQDTQERSNRQIVG